MHTNDTEALIRKRFLFFKCTVNSSVAPVSWQIKKKNIKNHRVNIE